MGTRRGVRGNRRSFDSLRSLWMTISFDRSLRDGMLGLNEGETNCCAGTVAVIAID